MTPALLATSPYIVVYLGGFLFVPSKVKCQLKWPSRGLQPCTLEGILCSKDFNQLNLLYNINLPPVTNLVKINATDLFHFRFITRQRLFCSQPDTA